MNAHRHRIGWRRLLAASTFLVLLPAPASAKDIERQLHFTVTVEAEQGWKKNDPKYPGEQWSKATSQQRYEVTTRLRSDGQLEVRNLLDPDLSTRLEAKAIRLARMAKKGFDASGKPFKMPKTDAELQAFNRRMQEEVAACKGQPTCSNDTTLRYAAIFAAMQYPQALEPDTEPGTYLYFMAYKGCPGSSRVTMQLQIDGVRYNKTSDAFVPFSEHRSADTVNASDGLSLCEHFTAVIDTEDAAKPMLLENVFVPSPFGTTDYTENGHTSHAQEPQPMPSAVLDWLEATLRHAPASGKASATLPLPLSLNGNSTWLGLWQGTAKVNFEWAFTPLAPSGAAPVPPAAASPKK